jgi:outer membrane protein assembly factor BamB
VVGDFQGYLHWLDKATGEIVAREKTDGERITNTPVAAEPGVFVQTDSGKLLVFRSRAPETPADAAPADAAEAASEASADEG